MVPKLLGWEKKLSLLFNLSVGPGMCRAYIVNGDHLGFGVNNRTLNFLDFFFFSMFTSRIVLHSVLGRQLQNYNNFINKSVKKKKK